jgi:hypothetical protein
MNSNSVTHLDKAMTEEQFNQVVNAILDGKYSWACVLILRFAGYNPLHYIPYRTYNRLLKDNTIANEPHRQTKQPPNSSMTLQKCFNHLEDLAYLETMHELPAEVKGGLRYTLCDRLMAISSRLRR